MVEGGGGGGGVGVITLTGGNDMADDKSDRTDSWYVCV